MKIAILLCLVAAASAGQIFGAAPALYGAGVSSTGESAVQRQEDGIGNYAFSVSEQGATGGTTQQETGDVYGRKQGSYSLGVIDGRQRRVDWVADELGFRARVDTNEPGTVASAPADVLINSPNAAVPHVAPVAAPVAAPIVQHPIVQHQIAAPLAIPRPVVAAPIAKVLAPQVYAQQIAVPRPVVYSSQVAHAPLVKTIAPQIVSQPIVQQAIAVPKPIAYSTGVVSHSPIAGIARPYGLAYNGLGLGLNHGLGLHHGLGLGLTGLNTLGLNTVGLNTLGYNTLGLNTLGLNTLGYNTLGLRGLPAYLK